MKDEPLLVEPEPFRPERISGVEVLAPITDDERFATWHIKLNGQEAFLKASKTNDSRQRLVNEIWGNTTMAQLAEADDAPFRVPRIMVNSIREGWFITEFIDGQALSPGDYSVATVQAAEPVLLEIYAFMDQAIVPEPSYGPVRFGSSKTADDLEQKIRGKFDSIPQAMAQFDSGLIDDALKYVTDNYDRLKPAFAHGDLTPKHVMAAEESQPYIIDFESASLYWPRFYELINYTTKINIVHGLGAESGQFITRFFERIEESVEEHSAELKAVAAIRALLIVHELAARPTNQRIYDTQLSQEHRGRVEEVLRLCLSDKPLV